MVLDKNREKKYCKPQCDARILLKMLLFFTLAGGSAYGASRAWEKESSITVEKGSEQGNSPWMFLFVIALMGTVGFCLIGSALPFISRQKKEEASEKKAVKNSISVTVLIDLKPTPLLFKSLSKSAQSKSSSKTIRCDFMAV